MTRSLRCFWLQEAVAFSVGAALACLMTGCTGEAGVGSEIGGSLQYIRGGERAELYDLRADPRQENNLAEQSDAIDAFRMLVASRADLPAEAETMEMDEELRKELRSLGYLQ